MDSTQKFFTRSTIILIAITICIIFLDIPLQLSPEKNHPGNNLYTALYSILYLYGALYGFRAYMKLSFRNSLGKALFFLSCGLFSYVIALFIWSYYNIFSHIEIPYPSVADGIFIFIFIPAMAYGSLVVLKIFKSLISISSIIEGILISIGSFLFVTLVLTPINLSSSLTSLAKLTNIATVAGDTMLLTISFIIVRTVGGKLRVGVMILAIGFILQVLADYLFSFRTYYGLYWNGDISDVIYALSGASLSKAVIYLSDQFVYRSTPSQPNK